MKCSSFFSLLFGFMYSISTFAIYGEPKVSEDTPVISNVAYLKLLNRRFGSKSGCSGVVISRRHILTSGHCLFPDKYRVERIRLGKNASSWKVIHSLPIERVIRHPKSIYPSEKTDYVKEQVHAYDIGIVKVAEDLPEDWEPAPLASIDEIQNAQNFIVAGYGSSVKDLDKWSTLGFLRMAKLSRFFHELFPKEETAICMTDLTDKTGLSGGDSGAGVFIDVNGELHLAGISSWVADLKLGSDLRRVGVAVRITEHIDWIREQIKP